MKVACLATIPGRDATLTIESLKPQVDQLFVVYNMTDIANDAFGDAAKFLPMKWRSGYMFTCDDDLIYPPDYVETMIAAIEKYERKAIITCHGRTFPDRKITSYYRDKEEGFRCLGTVEIDTLVHSGGTGVMAWHSDLFQPHQHIFERANMADIWIARLAKKESIPIVCISHQEGWLQYVHQEEGSTIWEQKINDDSFETEVFNSFWP